MAEHIKVLAIEGIRAKGLADAQAISALAVAGKADGTDLIQAESRIPTWRQRDYTSDDTPVGKPYKWQGQVYKLWQQHDATAQSDWSPDKAVSLWDICHTTDPALAKEYTAPEGTRGLWQVDECCVQGSRVWRNLTADNDRSPSELPERWEDLGTAEEIQATGSAT